jgi:hypothetical protein
MILITTLLITLLITIAAFLLSRQRLEEFKFPIWIVTLSGTFLAFGLLLMIFSASDISESLLRKTWPTVLASIIKKDIIGERAYSPQLKCEYQIDGRTYTLTTDLGTPGFGRKKTRRQTSEIILDEYPEGSEVLVRYNPENPGEAYIRTGPYWSDYLKISLSVLLSSVGLFVIFAMIIKKTHLKIY